MSPQKTCKDFTKYIQAYGKEGITVDKLLIQNETDVNSKYPSCEMHPDQMYQLIAGYLRPDFIKNNIDTEIWAFRLALLRVCHFGRFTRYSARMVAILIHLFVVVGNKGRRHWLHTCHCVCHCRFKCFKYAIHSAI